ncbi:hypothetical protein GBA52_001176 [Prunus armeniaca]|nr:hypothetical protein GBA52_001176 [Prunus armeniaca]
MVNDPDVRVERIKLRLKKGTIVFSHINSCLFQINSLHFVSNMSTFLIPTPPSTQKQVNRSSGPVPLQEWIPFECLCRSGGYCSNNQTQSRIKREDYRGKQEIIHPDDKSRNHHGYSWLNYKGKPYIQK